jgi:hypothetical protein
MRSPGNLESLIGLLGNMATAGSSLRSFSVREFDHLFHKAAKLNSLKIKQI